MTGANSAPRLRDRVLLWCTLVAKMVSCYNFFMQTEIVQILNVADQADDICRAGEILKEGGLVAFPTETVYGLGGDALQPDASKKIYAAKGRPSDNPLIIHIAKKESLAVIARTVPQKAYRLAEAFWPGPLTMILEKSDAVPYETTGGMDTVAIRMPSHPVALALIEAGGGFIAAPSANTSGRPSPTIAKHVADDLSGKIPLILDGGAVGIGIESTIIDLTEETPMILRPGYITKDMLEEVLGETVRTDPGLIVSDANIKPKAPGMKYRHYAPKAQLSIVDGPENLVTAKMNDLAMEAEKSGKKVGIIATEETQDLYKTGIIACVGARADEDAIAKHLYQILREFDDAEVDVIYSESFQTPRIGSAIMNRLLKAAGHQVIHVER